MQYATAHLLMPYIYSATFTPFAARTQQYVKEQLGQADEKVLHSSPLLDQRQLALLASSILTEPML